MAENDVASFAAIVADEPRITGWGPALLDAMPMPAYLCDGEGVVIACNTKARALWGSSLQVGQSEQALRAVSQHMWSQASEDLAGQLPGEPHSKDDVEVVIQTATGKSLQASASVSRLMDGNVPTGMFLKCFRLGKPQDDAEDLFENGGVALRFVASDGTILRANRAELDMLGYREDEYVGHKLAEFDADMDGVSKIIEWIQAGQSVDKYPARLRGRDGRIRHVLISSNGRFHGGKLLHSRCFTVDVSERHRLLRMIRKRDKFSQQLLQAIPTAIYTTDVEGKITFFNDAAVDFAGRRPSLGEEWCVSWKLFQQNGTPLPHDQYPMARAIREARPLSGEVAIAERPDGSRITFAAFPRPLFDDNGDVIGAVNTLVDITAHQQTERALHELNAELEQRVIERTRVAEATFMDLHRSEHKFALLVGSIVDYAIYMLDPDGIITNWNIGAERIKGYRADEVIGTNFSRFYTPEDQARGVPATALATARREGHYDAEGWRVRKNGSRFWASVVLDPIIDQGMLVGFAKITRDITERMEAQAALVESEHLARGVIDTAIDGFAQLEEGGRIIHWNPRAEALFGWSRQEAMGRSLYTLIAADEDIERFKDSLQPNAKARTSQAGCQIVMMNREGNRIPVELSISSLSLNGNYRTNVFIRDLSEKLLIEEQLRQAQKMEAVGQLTGGLAHDFNNLLQGIIGSLDLIQLRVDAGNTPDVARFVRGALNSANRAAAMTHRLLAFSRRQPLDPRQVQANPLLLSMADLLQRTLGEQVTLTFELATDLWPTLCDPHQLESAVLNLSINARDAMPQGGCLHIRSRNVQVDEMRASQWLPATSDKYICIEVADNGIGMDAEVLEHAFEPFFTTKALGEGTGLGLSMVYGFARQSNGYCEIGSRPGKGTCIQVYLPYYAAATDEQARQVSVVAPMSSGKGEVVLVVEDEDVVRDIVVEVLHQLNYTTLEAIDGESGLAALTSNEAVHLLITDIGLPGMNGRVLANVARELRPELRVLLMTGYASDASAPGGFTAGMELITKPFTVEALANQLRKMLPV